MDIEMDEMDIEMDEILFGPIGSPLHQQEEDQHIVTNSSYWQYAQIAPTSMSDGMAPNQIDQVKPAHSYDQSPNSIMQPQTPQGLMSPMKPMVERFDDIHQLTCSETPMTSIKPITSMTPAADDPGILPQLQLNKPNKFNETKKRRTNCGKGQSMMQPQTPRLIHRLVPMIERFENIHQMGSERPVTPMTPSDPGTVVQLQNVVSTANLGCKLDLKQIVLRARNAEYNPKRFVALIREPRATAFIYKSGKIVCTGAKSEEDSRLAARKFARIIQRLGFTAKFLDFKIRNIVGSCDLKFPN